MAFDPGQLYNNPYLQLGAGLLMGAQPGGTFAGGLNMGLHNLQNMQRQQQATALLGMQIQQMVMKRQQQEAEARRAARMAAALGIPEGATGTSAQLNAYALASGDQAKYLQMLQEQTEKGPLVANYVGGAEPPGPAPKPGEIYYDGKGWKRMPEESQFAQTGRGIRSFATIQHEKLLEIESSPDFNMAAPEGVIASKLPQAFKSEQRQGYELEAAALVDRLNTYWSGAEVPEREIERRTRNISVQASDSPETIRRKQKLREQYIQEMETAAGVDSGGVINFEDLP